MRGRRLAITALGLVALAGASPALASAPTAEEVRSATYAGFRDIDGPVTLTDGHWEGPPFAPGGEARPTVSLVEGIHLAGDLDGDGVEEAVVLLAEGAGGTGELMHVAVVGRQDEELVNRATAFIGDRVGIRDATLGDGDGRIRLDVIRSGPEDAECCPGELATLGLVFAGGQLQPFDTGVAPTRLSLESISGIEWVLRSWTWGEYVDAEPEVTLRYENGRFAGRSGCNQYSATAEDLASDLPGDITVGPALGTRMACPDAEMAVERRFLKQLEAVSRMGFAAGRLVLSFEIPDRLPKVMVLERH